MRMVTGNEYVTFILKTKVFIKMFLFLLICFVDTIIDIIYLLFHLP